MKLEIFIVILTSFFICYTLVGQGTEAIGTFHKRRVIGNVCYCQSKFDSCMDVRGRTENVCNAIIKKNMCAKEYTKKHGKSLEKGLSSHSKSKCKSS